ncbi:MAG: ATP-binding protein, partial [Burkholderiaceae bacterium]
RFSQGSDFLKRVHGGTGLGLSLVREFVRMMGGEVRFETEPGVGSYFEFWVPELSREAPATNPAR